MKNVVDASGKMVALDGEHEFGLEWCGRQIKLWKGWYFKKKSRKKETIQLRYRWHIGEGEIYDTCWLELSREGEKLEQHRIRQEAYDVLKSDLKQEEYPGNIIFIVLESFIPHPKK